MRDYSPAFEQILEVIAQTRQYSIGDFLIEFFDSLPRHGRATGRTLNHGRMLSMFIKGNTTFGVGEVLQGLHRAAEEFCKTQDEESLYTLARPYQSFKSGRVALTSYAAQQVGHRLLEEQEAATDPGAGLHVFKPHRPGEEETELRLSWDTYGATTLADVQTILEKHQPLMFEYISLLVYPKSHKEDDGFRYRPPNVVCDALMLWFSLPTRTRSRRKSSVKSTTPTIAGQSGCRFSMGSYTTAVERHIPSLTIQAGWPSPQVTTTSSRPSQN